MMKILVVEDERLLADSLQTLLTGRGFSVDTANDGLTGLEYAKTDVYDLVILDVMMPGLDGYTVASRLRAEHHAVPILMLTAKSDLMDRVAGLNAGADYYLTKPFDSRELLACVGALLRRQGEQVDELTFGNTALDLSAGMLRCGSKSVRLSAREFDVMRILLQAKGGNVSKETLLERVWGFDSNAVENHVEVYAGFLRKKLASIGSNVRIAELDEMKFRHELWSHQPLTDFWRVGRGIAKKLEQNGLFTMGDVALCSERNEDLLYKLFGKNAELLIDHAWGWELTTIEAIKAYHPSSNSLSSGQVLHCPYEPQKAKLVVREMTDLLVLDLVDKGLVTDQMVLTVGYDIENLTDPSRRAKYHGAVEKDSYGREIPKQAHGSINLDGHTSSTRKIMCAVSELFDRIVDKNLLVRRMYVVANHVLPEADAPKKNDGVVQLDLFTDYAAEEEKQKAEDAALERERKIQKAALAIKKKYGKNAILRAMNLEEGATAKDRNAQIGGHKA